MKVGKDNWTYSSSDLNTENDINRYSIFREKNLIIVIIMVLFMMR